MRSVATVGLAMVLLFATGCGSAGSRLAAVPPCSLLTAAEVSAAAGSDFVQGHEFPSEADHEVLGCTYQSPKGWATVWTATWAKHTDAEVPMALVWPDDPRCDGQLEHADTVRYRAYVCTTGANIQDMYVLKDKNYLFITIGAGAPPDAARHLGELATTRLP
ncbi:hypothetical protein BCD49_32210 [Pseudofrankia sp. EUN1h]|nr:hypothetical protein BCD49_32210 [Pseudofrankia sp. EUN1h]